MLITIRDDKHLRRPLNRPTTPNRPTNQPIKLTGDHGAGGGDAVALHTGRDDGGGAALAGVDAGDGPAALPAAEVAALERAAHVGVGVLYAGLAVDAHRVRGGGGCGAERDGEKKKQVRTQF